MGEDTDVLITPMVDPGPMKAGSGSDPLWMLGRHGDKGAYMERQLAALDIAEQEGLPYAHGKNRDPILCHNCGGVLLRFDETCSASWAAASGVDRFDPCVMPRCYCPWWGHEQHVTGSRCDHCGADVPIVTLTDAQLAANREMVRVTVAKAGISSGVSAADADRFLAG